MADDTVEAAIRILRGDQNLYEAHVWANALRVVCDAAAVRAETLWHCAVCGGTLSCEDCRRGIVSPDMLG